MIERATRCRKTIEFLIRAKRDQGRSTYWIVMTWFEKIFYCSNMENELKSYHNKTLSKLWKDAGYLNGVEIGQYFMTHGCSGLQDNVITFRPKINSNDFGFFFKKKISRFEFDFRHCRFFWTIRIFGVFKFQSYTMWPYMCLYCGLFAAQTIPFRMLWCPWRHLFMYKYF